MAWLVRHDHMHGGGVVLGSHVARIGDDGVILGELPPDAVECCERMPSVFQRFESEAEKAAKAAEKPAPVVASKAPVESAAAEAAESEPPGALDSIMASLGTGKKKTTAKA